MTTIPTSDTTIGPEMRLADLRLPPHVGARLSTLFGRSEPIIEGDEWVGAMHAAIETECERAPTEADLCHASDGNHAVVIDGKRESFVCVLDPLIVPFLRAEPGRIESTTPEDGRAVTIEVTSEGVTVTPEETVVSLGVSHHVAADEQPTPETVYRQVCGYVHAFASPAEYERWATGVDAATTTVSAETGVAVARELSTALFEE